MIRVLVVEDDPHNALLFRKLLERRAGCSVIVTESAEEVLGHVRGGAIDLVIMDVSLANTAWQGVSINGIELCRMLKADAATSGVPVVLATAHAMRGDAEAFVEQSGADGYVSKPILDHGAFVEQVQAMARKAA
jgi:two-component system, cell cycle response regulator DivK